MTHDELAAALRSGDGELFAGTTAAHALGWLRADRYLGEWLIQIEQRLPRRHDRTLLLGMGGSSSPARFFAEASGDDSLTVLDTSNPDTIEATDFSGANVIASSKSGTTVETQTLLAHALAHGLDARDLVVVTDPGTSLAEVGHSLGALVVEGDPETGGRFSGLSPFGLVPALYGGWTSDSLAREFAALEVSDDLVEAADERAREMIEASPGSTTFVRLGGEPATSGGALWLEQLLAETTGKSGVGVVPLAGEGESYRPREMLYWHLVAALIARRLGVDPFNQPDVESAKRNVFTLLARGATRPASDSTLSADLLNSALYRTLQVYAPLEAASDVARLRRAVEERFGTTTANLGPRYLHSTGQLHKGGPEGVLAIQVIVRPRSAPQRIEGRAYSFHDLHRAQAASDQSAMLAARRSVRVLEVDTLEEAGALLQAAL